MNLNRPSGDNQRVCSWVSEPGTGMTSQQQQQQPAIPGELQETLLDFTVHYLIERPHDILDFALDYFNSLQARRLQEQGLGGGQNDHGGSEDESMQSEDDVDGEYPTIRKRHHNK